MTLTKVHRQEEYIILALFFMGLWLAENIHRQQQHVHFRNSEVLQLCRNQNNIKNYDLGFRKCLCNHLNV